MGWFSNLFLTSDSANKVVDGVVNAGDKLFYTEEEKEEGRQKMREWYINLVDALKPHNMAMRLLAMGVSAVWSVHLISSTALYILGVFICDIEAEVCLSASAADAIVSQMSEHINTPFLLVIGFYFGATGVNSAIATAIGKKK